MRRKADGTAFEREFRDAMKTRFYIRRLPTLNTGNAGSTQPADFIVIGNRFNYVEVKETAGDRFSVTEMQQYPEFIEFVEERNRLKMFGMPAVRDMEYVLVVHFLKHGVVRAIESKDMLQLVARRKTLKYDDSIGVAFTSVDSLVRGIEI